MGFVPVERTAQVASVYLLDQQIVENTLYFEKPSAPSIADLTALVDAVNNAIQTSLLPFMSSAIQLLRVVGKLLDIADGLIYVSTTGLPKAGLDSQDSMSSNVAACMSFRTNASGRSFRGRA